MFGEFYRPRRARAVDSNATGLGPAAVKRVEKWNGAVALDSSPGQGAAFTVTPPLAPE